MRLGLIGPGRIGSFHASTLAGMPAVDSLVATDLMPSKVEQVVERHSVEGVVAGNRPPPSTVADGFVADWIAEAATHSLREHRPVRIEEVRDP